MKSIHVRRLDNRVARTAARFDDAHPDLNYSVRDLSTVGLPWYTVRDQATDGAADEAAESATVFIFDEIGGSFGVDAAQFARDLEAITAPTIRVRINSPGGAVFDAIAIYNALNHHPARVVVYVDSLAASAASVVAMAGDEIVMMPGSQMMIHDAAAVEDGNAADMAAMSTFLDRQSDNIADLYRLRAGGDVAEWRELMLAETWMFAQEAVAMGLADRVEDKTPDDVHTDVDDNDLMTRRFDLGHFRYAGRRAAPAPARRHATTHDHGRTRRAAVTTTSRQAAVSGERRAAATSRAQAYRAAGVAPRAGVRSEPGIPLGQARSVPFGSQMRAELVTKDDRKFYRVEGYATVFEQRYEMWDMFGPYDETVAQGAADQTLAANPDVVFLVNHKGLSMARTTAKTLELAADTTGMSDVAWMNPERTDVKDLVIAIDDKVVTEQSFAFMITEGSWNADFTEFRIVSFDIHRGDVSAVNYGANPYTSIAARQRDIFAELDRMPAYAARAALTRLAGRTDVPDLAATGPATTTPTPNDRDHAARGRSITHIEALLVE